MKREEIMETIKSLASSQGLYGRLYRDLMELDEDEYEQVMLELESQNFKDEVDLVMFIEGQGEQKVKLKDLKLKENEELFIGYFDNKGFERKINNSIQRVKGWAFEHIKNNCQELEVSKVKNGYATNFAKKEMNRNI